MKLINFPQANVHIAENPSEYKPIPSYYVDYYHPQGQIICCWKLSFWERIKLLFTGKVWHKILTYNEPVQPQFLLVDNPFDKSI